MKKITIILLSLFSIFLFSQTEQELSNANELLDIYNCFKQISDEYSNDFYNIITAKTSEEIADRNFNNQICNNNISIYYSALCCGTSTIFIDKIQDLVYIVFQNVSTGILEKHIYIFYKKELIKKDIININYNEKE